MFDLIRTYQLDIMLFLCGTCGIMTVLLALTRFLPQGRKAIMIQMELVAFFLLFFDRLAYIYDRLYYGQSQQFRCIFPDIKCCP